MKLTVQIYVFNMHVATHVSLIFAKIKNVSQIFISCSFCTVSQWPLDVTKHIQFNKSKALVEGRIHISHANV